MSAQIIRFPTRPSRLALHLERFDEDRSVLMLIWALYFALRVAVLLIPVMPPAQAAADYAQAAGLANGHGYLGHFAGPTPPGWPLALSLVFAQFGASPVVLGLFNLTSALLIGQMTLSFGRRLFGSEATARAGLLLLAVYPAAIGQVPLALDGLFRTALLMAACWTVMTRSHRWQLLTAGLLFGLCALVEPQSLIAIPLLFTVDGLCKKTIQHHLPSLLTDMLLVAGVAIAITLPWAIPNLALLHQWALALPNPDLLVSLRQLWLADGSVVAAYGMGAVTYADLACYAVLMLAFAAAIFVMVVKRRRIGQRWIGWWLLPYAIVLAPTLSCAIMTAPSRDAVLPFVCITAGWLFITIWNALAERGRPPPTLH